LPAGVAAPVAARRVWLDAAMIVALLIAGAPRLSASQLEVHLDEDLRSLEPQIGDWTIEIDPPPMAVRLPSIDDELVNVGGYPTLTGERRFVAVDDELVRVYRDASGNRVRLYVGYYHRQEEGKELTGEAGTDLADAASPLTLTAGSLTLEVGEIVRAEAELSRGVLFWYNVNGRIISDFYRLKSYTIWDAVTRRRTNGAVVMVAWDSPAGAESEVARERAIEFAQTLIPVLRRRLPV
jgi:EpsI family protein